MLRIPIYKTAIARTFYFRTFKLWNSLHPSLKKKPTLKDFKSYLRKNLHSFSYIFSYLLLLFIGYVCIIPHALILSLL